MMIKVEIRKRSMHSRMQLPVAAEPFLFSPLALVKKIPAAIKKILLISN